MFIFDFDGVLMDSSRECCISSYNTVTGKLLTREEELPPGVMQCFLSNHIHLHSAYGFYVLMSWCLSNECKDSSALLNKEGFLDFANRNISVSKEEALNSLFTKRLHFLNNYYPEWLKLNSPMEPIWSWLKENYSKDIVLLTTKNKKAVMNLSAHYGLNVREENIYSGDNSVGKIENFNSILDRFGEQEYWFIDDHLKNLTELDRAFNVNGKRVLSLALSHWGYGDKADFEVARKLGYEVLSQEEVIGRLQVG